jgi:hypothetical protein
VEATWSAIVRICYHIPADVKCFVVGQCLRLKAGLAAPGLGTASTPGNSVGKRIPLALGGPYCRTPTRMDCTGLAEPE